MAGPIHDPALTLIAILGAMGLVFASRRFARPSDAGNFPRKTLHAAVGGWTLALTPLFHHLGWAVVAPALFFLLNASGRVRSLLPQMAGSPRERRGLWTFPLAVVLTYLLFWEESPRPAILAGVAALAFADPAASLAGSRFGQRRIRGGSGRTLEGSLVFLVVAAVTTGLVASLAESGAYPWRMGIGCGIVGAVTEAVTPGGWDNLTVPLAVAAAFRLLA